LVAYRPRTCSPRAAKKHGAHQTLGRNGGGGGARARCCEHGDEIQPDTWHIAFLGRPPLYRGYLQACFILTSLLHVSGPVLRHF
jgi:hypothetical protein